MKRTWPQIRRASNHGKIVFVVDARRAGKGERKFFDTKSEAEGFAQTQRIRRINEGNAAFDDARLAKYGWTVAKAIEFAIEHLERQNASVDIADAVKGLVAYKTGRVGKTRLGDIKNRLARFVDHFPKRTISTITAEDINAFLETIPHPATRNDYRKEIVMLWAFSLSKKWVAEKINKYQVERAPEPDKARTILTIDQTVRLMVASVDDDIRALNALVLFGGCRREEVEKLDWSNINFKTGHIEISAEISKVNRERFAPIPSNLRSWLRPIAKKSGPIVSRILMHALRETWKRAVLYPWPQDAHRHSFISYRRRIIGDAETALDAGTSEKIIKKHYKRPTTKAQAKRYFSIRPVGVGRRKVVDMKDVA